MEHIKGTERIYVCRRVAGKKIHVKKFYNHPTTGKLLVSKGEPCPRQIVLRSYRWIEVGDLMHTGLLFKVGACAPWRVPSQRSLVRSHPPLNQRNPTLPIPQGPERGASPHFLVYGGGDPGV